MEEAMADSLKKAINEIDDSMSKRAKITSEISEVEKNNEREMKLRISDVYQIMFNNPPQARSIVIMARNPVFLKMLQELVPHMQKEWFSFVGLDSFLDFKEPYVTVMELLMDLKLYTDFVILYRMRVTHIYKLWEGTGNFLKERGYPIHAFMMYLGVGLMRMQTRPFDKDNAFSLQKALDLAKEINSSDNKQMAVYAFHEIWKNWSYNKSTKLSLYLHALLNKALSTYFIRHGHCFYTAMDFEIKYLNQIYELGFFAKNIEWLICNLLNLTLYCLDISYGARRLKQAKHLLYAVRMIMGRCNRMQARYQLLYELYELCKSAYWAIKIQTTKNEISNRFEKFNMHSMSTLNSSETDEIYEITSEQDIIETYQKIEQLSQILTKATSKEVALIYDEIVRNCHENFSFL